MLKTLRKNIRKGALFRKYFTHSMMVVLTCLVIFGLVLMISIAGQWWNEKIDLLSENSNKIVQVVKDNYEKSDDNDQLSSMWTAAMLRVISNATNSDYFIVNEKGEVVLCKDVSDIAAGVGNCEEHGGMVIPEKYMRRALSNGLADYSTEEHLGLGRFVVAIPINIDGETIGAVFGVEDAISGLLPYMLNISNTILIIIIISILICFIVLYISCERITNPLSEMQEVTKHFAKGDFDHRANENYEERYHREFARALNRMADELQNNEEARRSFVANVSHELKTPMTTIGGFVDGILDGTIKKEKSKEYLEIVSNEVKRLSRIVVTMLNLSKIEAGEVSIAPVEYDISSQLFETMLLFEHRINENHLAIEGFEEMGSVRVTADRDLIAQVIYNLLDNAVKFTPENGKISVYAQEKDHKTTVRIRNSGKGVSDKEISRLFERFYKVDKSRSYDVKGVGLGLYIVKTIINMHDGDIWATSVENEYTEFVFEIPNLM